ncbi:M3 family metallopeptidase, partial [Wenyingzhuangia sp. 1_MG-2023]|nr:M3 family metallopeptidase [Wenyingzhuangia sp. 1_MG-2023]
TDEAELAGLPDSAKSLLAQLAQQKELEGYLITLDFPSFYPVLTYADNRELRREVYTANVTRASDVGPNAGEFDNSALMLEILQLRYEQAQLLGYESYAALSLASKMADTPDQVLEFLNDLAQKAKPQAEREIAELKQFALEEYGADD